MVSLSTIQQRFEIPYEIVEGGSGTIYGVTEEADQKNPPSYVFASPRLVVRVRGPNLITSGVTLRSPEGVHYLAGYNGPSETSQGNLWNSFRLYRATNNVLWQRRVKIIDQVTRLPQDNGLEVMGNIWVVIEPIAREVLDRRVHTSLEFSNYLATAKVQADDMLNGKQVTRADDELGLRIGTMT
jgi:hypothetical protein